LGFLALLGKKSKMEPALRPFAVELMVNDAP
jgi:hypothetical protein